ncbi:hypothetical protein ON010_g4672 [Phytophthora cinnamomi]|nr:hypothetical protein ON010_g4672 [Phytophthora cinnamomi]
MLLKETAQIYAEFNDEDQPPHGSPINVSSAMRSVRCCSDDAVSELVNVLVPGFGRCLVERRDLVFQEFKGESSTFGSVTSLKVDFEKGEGGHRNDFRTDSSGLPQLLELIGSQMKNLTLDGPRDALEEM